MKIYTNSIIFIVFTALSLSALSIEITNISGDMSNGETITISGIDFGDKSIAGPVMSSYDNVNNANNFSSGSIGGNWYTTGPTLTSSPAYQRTPFYQDENYVDVPYLTDGYQTLNYDGDSSLGTHFYTSMWLYINRDKFCASIASGNSKFWRWYLSATDSAGRISENIAGGSTGNCPGYYQADGNRAGIDYGIGDLLDYGPLMPLMEWVHHEVWVYAGTEGNTDGRYVEKINGKLFRDWSGFGLLPNAGAHSINYLRFGEVSGSNYAGGSIFLSQLYIDNTQAHVFISDRSSMPANWLYSDIESHDEVQVCSNWTSTSITCTLNQGSLNTAQDAYVYVVNSNGDVNTQGYKITFGGYGAANPSPPDLLIN